MSWPRLKNFTWSGISRNLMHLASQISRLWHANDLLLDIDYSYTSCKYIWDDMMSIRSKPEKIGHDLDLKISLQVVFHTVKCMLSWI